MKKALLLSVFVLVLTIVIGVQAADENSIYYLNFKPEVADIYTNEIAPAYEAETGVKLVVVTAASGTYEQTFMSEVAKAEPPVLFQINGPVGYQRWKEYCADLKGTELYQHLSDKSLAVVDGDGVYGIPYAVEGYGIIYNKAIMAKYFALSGAKAASMDEIKSFDALKAVAEDMTARKAELGIEGVFASTSLQPGEDWRWQTHLFNLPLYYEFAKNQPNWAVDGVKEITFEYGENFKNIFDLYINNSITDPKLLGSKQVNDSMAEFALGKVAMVQNGMWAYGQIAEVTGNVVTAEDFGFLPIYIGAPDEEKQGLCVGTENFFAINAKASPEKQKLAADFIYWLYSSDTGKKFVTEKLGFIAPFDTFGDEDKPTNPLAADIMNWMSDGSTSVSWAFTVIPSQQLKDDFGGNLLGYAQGQFSWDELTTIMIEEWPMEYEITFGG